MFEKKRRIMMGDNSQDKPQERQLESDKKEVASSVTDSKDPTPKFSSPVKRAPKEKPKEGQSVDSDEFVNAEDSKKDEGRYFLYGMLKGMLKELYDAVYSNMSGWFSGVFDAVEKVRNRMDGYDADAIRRHKEVKTMLGKIETIVERLAETGTDDSSNNSPALRREDLPDTGYCYYDIELREWKLTFDGYRASASVGDGKAFSLSIPWEELFGQEEEKYYF